jgi:HSP20 family molecular chaperone IbpA
MKTMKPVAVHPMDARGRELKLEAVREQVRRHAYDLYCRRGNQHGTALDDWLRAEHEVNLAPLAGVAECDRDIRITACVPGVDARDLAVDSLPEEIIIEQDRNGGLERMTRFPLPSRIETDRVEAGLRGSKLEVMAPKARKSNRS